MNNDRIRYRLRSTDSQVTTDTDTFIKLNLEGSRRLLPKNDINETVNSAEVFNTERQNSKKYRIFGTIKPLASNVLFNLTSNYNSNTDFSDSESYGWTIFNNNKFKLDPIDNFNDDTGQYTGLTFQQSYTKFLKEKDGWFGFYNPDILLTGNCDFYTMEPKKERFSFKPTSNKKWELTLTYPFSADTTHYIVSGTTISGLKIIGQQLVNIGGRDMVAFSTPVRHNLTQGSLVRIEGLGPQSLDGLYRVTRTGLDDGSMRDYYFSVDIDPTLINSVNNARVRRVLGGTQNGFESKYYLRLFKKITTVNTNINNGIVEDDDYEIYQAAFSQTVFNDEVCQFVFNEDIDVSNIRDNLGRPISEMFLTIVKTRDNNFFTPIQAGLECGNVNGIFDVNIPDVRQLRDGPNNLPNYNDSPIPLTSSVTIGDDYFYGDVVEYNNYELIENVLGVVGHRFNTENRTLSGFTNFIEGPRHEGYFYYPHHRIKIRDYSTYIEQGNANTIGIPDYALDLGDGRWLWRDLLDIGVNDGQEETLNYPFLNGAHYIYQNYCFPVRRQDPYGQYDLYYGPQESGNIAPFDIVGVGITNNFDVNSAEDAC